MTLAPFPTMRPTAPADERYTPAPIVALVREALGAIDLDPASCATAQQTVQATRFYTVADDGLALPWHSRVFCNPPYSAPLAWVRKALDEHAAGRTSATILLLRGDASTQWARLLAHCWICDPHGRINFEPRKVRADGSRESNDAPSRFYLIGGEPERFAHIFSAIGAVRGPAWKEAQHG